MSQLAGTHWTTDLEERLAPLVARRGDGAGLVALAASAGGLSALGCVLSGLPGDYPLPVTIVQHLDPNHPSHLAQLLSRRTRLSVKDAEDGEALAASTVFLARPGFHLLVTGDRRLRLSDDKPIHFLRPAADLLFASIAASYGAGAIAVVLTGTGVDGGAGVCAIRRGGGVVLAQDPAGAEFPGMPESAAATQCVDLVLPLRSIAGVLVALAEQGVR